MIYRITFVQKPSSQTLRTLPTKTVFGHNYESINANCTHFLPALSTAPMSAFGVDTLVCLRTNPTFSMVLPSSKDHLLKPYARSLRRQPLDIIARISILKPWLKPPTQFSKWRTLLNLKFHKKLNVFYKVIYENVPFFE